MKVHRFIGVALTAAAAMQAGCASTSGARSEATTGAATEPAREPDVGMMGGACPMQVPGTTVTATDVEGGVALSFTTSTGDVVDLRQRVRRMAEMHNRHHSGGMMMGGPGGARGPAPPPGP